VEFGYGHGVIDPASRPTRRLSIRVPADLMELVESGAELAHTTVDKLVEDVLTREMARWEAAFPAPVAPEDLRQVLNRASGAMASFNALSRRRRGEIIHHIEAAVRPAARARRIDRAITMLTPPAGEH
jgi:uncharacterized protein YdeI (YjbR/CyaY-like superfamily)